MKNVIFMVCDGLSYDMTIDNRFHKSPMKFLQQLNEYPHQLALGHSIAFRTKGGLVNLPLLLWYLILLRRMASAGLT